MGTRSAVTSTATISPPFCSNMSSTNVEMSTSTTSDAVLKSADEQKACGYSQLSLGKRHLLVSDIPEAVSTLALASELLAKQFGETHPECAEAYFYYGKSLLEMSRLESGVLGNALEGVPEGGDLADDSQIENPENMSKDEMTEVETKVKEALDFNYQTCKVELEKAEEAALEADSMEGDDASQEGGEGDEAMEDDSAEAVAKPEGESPSTTEKPMEDEEEPSNLQQAWEMLELAKLIYTKQSESAEGEKKVELDRKVCETYLHLGEVSLENENYVQAVEDLSLCLSKRQASLPSDSRSIAETHYQLGVSLAFSGKFDEAETSLESAISVLKQRIQNLQKMESSEYLTKEISELQELIKEIKEKVVDHGDMKASASKKIKECFSSESGSSDAKVVSSIGVKRKEDLAEHKTEDVTMTAAAN